MDGWWDFQSRSQMFHPDDSIPGFGFSAPASGPRHLDINDVPDNCVHPEFGLGHIHSQCSIGTKTTPSLLDQ